MASFETAIPVILIHEGGFVNHPSDPGGATNFGISLRFLADHPGVGDFDGDGDVDVEDIANMTQEQACEIYRQFWWDKYRYDLINDQTIATKIFDMAVNMGAGRAHRIVQASLNKAFGLKLSVDGIIGNTTRGVLNACTDDDEQLLLSTICDEQFAFYQRLVASRPHLSVFINGWKNRAYSVHIANSV